MPTYRSNSGLVPGPGGSQVARDITAPTQITTGRGTVHRVYVTTAPSAVGGVYDLASGGTPSPASLIAIIPTDTDPVEIAAPFYDGLYVDPGSGGTVSVSYGP